MHNGTRRVLRDPDAATFLGITRSTLTKWRVAGRGPRFIRLGSRAIGYDLRDLEEWIEENKATSTSTPRVTR